MKYTVIVIATLLLSACAPEQGVPASHRGQKTSEIIEIYNVKQEGSDHTVGDLRYKEHNEYHGDQLYGTIYYNRDGSIRGKSIVRYEDGDLPSGAHFVDPQDSVMSYYKYIHDDQGRKQQVIAFDPVNREILREERFYYDAKDNLKSKLILDDAGNIRQRFNWTYDVFGNERAMMADNGDNTPLTTHEHRITRYDADSLWLEKWTFIDDEPAAYYKIKRR